MKAWMFRATPLFRAITLAAVISVAAPASVALAQDSQGGQSASGTADPQPAGSKPEDVSGVVVEAPKKLDTIPPAKRAAFDAEAAKRKASTTYRSAPPTATAAAGAAGTAPAGSQAGTYPGLKNEVAQ
jgi:hypothetical protein